MNQYVQRIERDFPVRRKTQEKENMRTYLIGQLRNLGYDAKLQECRNATNVVVGDIDKAKMIFTAHYDTGLYDILPQFISPARPVTYILYQVLLPLLVLIGSFLISFGLTFALNMPAATLPLFVLLLILSLVYLRFGPSETRNANDNTSGVAALLETAEHLTPRYRSEVAFVFLDGGAMSMQGAKGLRKQYPCVREKVVINLDCVGSGDEILILPSKYNRWNGDLIDAINESFENTERKHCFNKVDGLVFYPSDNRAFRYSVNICACNVVAGFGRCLNPKRKDGAVDEENLEIIRKGLTKLVMNFIG